MKSAADWSAYLTEAEEGRVAVAPITDSEPISSDFAYEVQAHTVAAKLARGDAVVGAKLGLTSKAKQVTMKVDQPIYGVLTASMALELEAPLRISDLIHPRVEPEIAFITGEDLTGPGVSHHDVLDATAWVTAGLEIIDSRFADFRFTHADVVADNTSASRFLLGPTRVPPAELGDLALLGCVVEADGRVTETAAGAAVLGHPASAVALLVNWLGRTDHVLPKGSIVLSGGLTNAHPLRPGGWISASFAKLGTVTLRGA